MIIEYKIKNKINNNIPALSTKNAPAYNFGHANDCFIKSGNIDDRKRSFQNLAENNQEPLCSSAQTQTTFKGSFSIKPESISKEFVDDTLKLIGKVESKDEKVFREALEKAQNKLFFSNPLSSVVEFFKTPIQELEKNVSKFVDICDDVKSWKKKGLSENEILDKLRHNKLSNFDENKGGYASNKLSSVFRLVTGATTAFFYAFDFHNSSIALDNNSNKASECGKQRFKQELTSVGFTAGLLFLVTSIFKKACNKSLKTTFLIYLGTVAFAEIASRLINKRPILPISVDKAKKLGNKKLLKPYDFPKYSLYTGFQSNAALKTHPTRSNITFKGAAFHKLMSKYNELSVAENYSREELSEIMHIIEKQLPEQHKWICEVIKTNYQKTNNLKNIKLEDILNDKTIANIPLGKNDKFLKTVIDGLFGDAVRFVNKIFSQKNTKEEEAFNTKLEDVQNIVKFVQTKIQYAKNNNIKDVDAYVKNEIESKGPYSTDNISYDATTMSNSTRLISIIPGALFCMDIYNLMMQRTHGDKAASLHETKERGKQVAIKLVISAIVLQLANKIFKKSYNKNLGRMILVACGSTILYETLTRKLLKIPVLPQKSINKYA